MKIVADEDVDGRIVRFLRALGHEVIYVAEISPRASDAEVIQFRTLV